MIKYKKKMLYYLKQTLNQKLDQWFLGIKI